MLLVQRMSGKGDDGIVEDIVAVARDHVARAGDIGDLEPGEPAAKRRDAGIAHDIARQAANEQDGDSSSDR